MKDLIERCRQFLEWESSYPPSGSSLSQQYGGIPGGGGYGSATEYEIGAQRIAEAAHCILGSCGKSHLGIETGHIKEEIRIIEDAIEEYSRPIYLSPENFRLDTKYAQKTLKNLVTVSKRLKQLAISNKKKIGDVEPERKDIAEKSYDVLIALADAMMKTQLPYGTLINQFDNPKLVAAVKRLRNTVNKYV